MERKGVTPFFSDLLTEGDVQVLFDLAHEALEEVLRVAPADFLARLPSAIPLYVGSMPGAHANVELGLVNSKLIPGTDYEYEQTIPEILGITLHHLKHEQMREPFLEGIRSSIRHELLHILTHQAVNVNLRSVTEWVVATLEKAHFGKGVTYGEGHKPVEINNEVISLTGGFRSPDGTQILYKDDLDELLYIAACYSLEQVEATELWEIVRRLTAIADDRKMYPLYKDIRSIMQDVLSKERTELIENTPSFREMTKGNYAMALYDGEFMTFTCISVQSLDDCSIQPLLKFQPYRHAVTLLPSVGYFGWQAYQKNEKIPEYGDRFENSPPQFRLSPRKLIEAQMRQFQITRNEIPIDRMKFTLYEYVESPHAFFECEISNPVR